MSERSAHLSTLIIRTYLQGASSVPRTQLGYRSRHIKAQTILPHNIVQQLKFEGGRYLPRARS